MNKNKTEIKITDVFDGKILYVWKDNDGLYFVNIANCSISLDEEEYNILISDMKMLGGQNRK